MQRTRETGMEKGYVDGNSAAGWGQGWPHAGEKCWFSFWVINPVIHSHATPSLCSLSAIPSLVTLAGTADLNYGSSQVCGSLPGCPPSPPGTDLGVPRLSCTSSPSPDSSAGEEADRGRQGSAYPSLGPGCFFH